MKKITVITLAILIICSSIFGSIQVFAAGKENLQDIKNKREQIRNNLSDVEVQVNSLMSEIDILYDEIAVVNEEISKNEALISQTEEEITDTIDEISKLQKEIQELESDIEKRHRILNDRISSYQKSGGSINYLEVLFGAKSFTDFISRMTMVNTITKSDADLIKTLEEDIKSVDEKKTLSLKSLESLNDLKLEQEEALALVQEQKKQNEEYVSSLEAKQNNLLTLISDLKTEDRNLASIEEDVKRKIADEEARKAKLLEKQKSNETSNTTLNHVNSRTLTVTSTAYTVNCAGCSGITYTGINLMENPDAKVIAVDPTVIPLGTVVHVEGYGYAIAGDVGSAIKGNKIDVFLPSRADALKWGVRRVKVTIQ